MVGRRAGDNDFANLIGRDIALAFLGEGIQNDKEGFVVRRNVPFCCGKKCCSCALVCPSCGVVD